MRKQILCLIAFCLLLFPIAATSGCTESDPAGDVYRGTTVGYRGAGWAVVSDPAVDLLTITLTGNTITITVTGGLSSIPSDQYVVFCVISNSTGGSYQQTMFMHQSGAWSCAVIDSGGSAEMPAPTVTDTSLTATTAGIAFSCDDVTVYAVNYISMSPAVMDIDFYPDSHFASLAPGGGSTGDTFLGLSTMWWWIIIAVIAIIIVIIIVIATRGPSDNGRGQKARQPKTYKKESRGKTTRKKGGRK